MSQVHRSSYTDRRIQNEVYRTSESGPIRTAEQNEQANSAFTASYSGFVVGEGAGDLQGSLSFVTVADKNSTARTYPVLLTGITSNNYQITFVNGTLLVTSPSLVSLSYILVIY